MTEATSAPATEWHSEQEVRDAVLEVILALAPIKGQQADDDSLLADDLGYHSLALLELAFSLEDEFDLAPIDEQTAQSITTVKAVADHVIGDLRAREIEGPEN